VRAFVIDESSGALTCEVREIDAAPSDQRDVLVDVEYSSVNFKDEMVATAPSRVRRVPTIVGGVDAAGVVATSPDDGVEVGTLVAVHGGDLGVARNGGFATQVYAPTRFLSPLPPPLSARDAMVFGTAGFTAMASVLALEDRGLAGGATVLVTGATGGVGSQAVHFLALRGYRPVASTGSHQHAAWLEDLGATAVIGRDEIGDRPTRVLDSERWDGAVDCVGGATLHAILRSLRYGAAVAASGLVASADLNTTIYPFITRGVALLGIDAPDATATTRQRVWQTLADVAPVVDFEALVDREVTLEELPNALAAVRSGATRGRILVRTNGVT
jgi:putative YhdH/YhfP family quinone oxidoreductase